MTDRQKAIQEAKEFYGEWPTMLTSGVMFYRGVRITREEFEADANLPKPSEIKDSEDISGSRSPKTDEGGDEPEWEIIKHDGDQWVEIGALEWTRMKLKSARANPPPGMVMVPRETLNKAKHALESIEMNFLRQHLNRCSVDGCGDIVYEALAAIREKGG